MTTLVVGDLQSGKSTSLVQKVEQNLAERPQVVVTTNSEVCLNNLLPRFSKRSFLKDSLPNIYLRQKMGKPLPQYLLPVVMANKYQLQKIKDIFVGTGTPFDLYIDEADCFNLKGATTSVQRNNIIAWIATTVKNSVNTNLVNDTHYTATPHNPFFTSIVYDEVKVVPPGKDYKAIYDFPLEEMEKDICQQVKYEASKSGKRIIIVCTEKLQKEHHKQAHKLSLICPNSLVVVVNSAKGNKIWCKGTQKAGNFSDMEKYFEYAKKNGFENIILVGGDMFTRAVTFKDRDAEFEFGAMFYKMGNSKNLVSVIQTIGRIAGYQSFYPTIYCEQIYRLEHGILIHQQTSELVKSTSNELFQEDLSVRQDYLRDNIELKDWMFDTYQKQNGWVNSKGRDVDSLENNQDEDYSLGVPFDFKIPKNLLEACVSNSPARSKNFKYFIDEELQKEYENIEPYNVEDAGWCKVPTVSNKSLVTWWQDPVVTTKPPENHRCFIYALITKQGNLFKRTGQRAEEYEEKDLPYRVRGSFQSRTPWNHSLEEGERYDLYNPVKDKWEVRHYKPDEQGLVKKPTER